MKPPPPARRPGPAPPPRAARRPPRDRPRFPPPPTTLRFGSPFRTRARRPADILGRFTFSRAPGHRIGTRRVRRLECGSRLEVVFLARAMSDVTHILSAIEQDRKSVV